jgi:porin
MWKSLLVHSINLIAILGGLGTSAAGALAFNTAPYSLDEAKAIESTKQGSFRDSGTEETKVSQVSEALIKPKSPQSSASAEVTLKEGLDNFPGDKHSSTEEVVIQTPSRLPPTAFTANEGTTASSIADLEKTVASPINPVESPTEEVVIQTPSSLPTTASTATDGAAASSVAAPINPVGSTAEAVKTQTPSSLPPTASTATDGAAADSINASENSATSPPLPASAPISTTKDNCHNLALPDATISYSAADLGGELVADSPPPETPGGPVFSRALNLLSLRSLKKPVAEKVLDTGFNIAGRRLRDTSESFWTRDFLTGNWGGLRDELYEHGIDITLAHFAEVFGVVDGGKQRASAYNGVSVISFDFYTGKLGLWPGGQVHLTTSWLEGTSVTREYVGSLNTVYFADPPRKGYRLFELWYGQKLANNQLELRIGKIYPFVKIGITQSTNLFSNASFQYPTFLGSTNRFGVSSAFAVAPFGIQVLYDPTPQWFFYANLQDGFDDPSGGIDNFRGLSIGLSAKEGVEGIIEAGYKLNQEKGSTGLPGTYRLGFQFHTGQFKDTRRNENGGSLALAGGSPKIHTGNYAFYFVGEQMIFRESPDPSDRRQGLTTFFKTVFSPKDDINTVSFHIDGGLVYEGLIPGRDRDVLGIGVSYSQLSGGLRNFSRDLRRINPEAGVLNGETVIELAYAAEIAPWWILIGSVQEILAPGGSSATPDATVLGISSRFAF